VQLLTIWQDLAQVTARYGDRAATVVNNHRAKIFLSGTSDPGTLDRASHLVGDEELLVPSTSRDSTGRRVTTATPVQRRLLPPEALRRLPTGTGVLVYGSLPPVRLALRPWWEDAVLRPRAARPGGGSAEPAVGSPGRTVTVRDHER
jgi:type IV secretory pathway TraG/TraD family ATPase VirD4